MIVQVRDEHIRRGKRKDMTACPVALAVYDAIKNEREVRVTHHMIGFHYRGAITYSTLPIEATQFIKAYDEGEDVAPFEFYLAEY